MKISLLKLKNCLGIKEFEVKPGQITIIQGGGKQGKTSILDSIEKALYNTNKRPEFVHGNTGKAETYLMLDDGMEIKKTINTDGKVATVKIEKDGMSPKSPETFLKGLVGEKQLNPIEFIGKSDKEQIETILALIPIEVTEEDIKSWNISKVTADYQQHGLKVCKQIEDKLFATRAEINKEIKLLSADVENLTYKLPSGYDADKWRDVSLTEKYQAISEANKINGNIERANVVIDGYDAKVAQINAGINSDIAKLEQQIEDLKKKAVEQAADETNKFEAAKKYIKDTATIDITPLEEDHKETEVMKSYIRIADELTQKKEHLKDAEKESKELTTQIELVRKKPQELLSKAEMPISGLSIDEEGTIRINNMHIKNLCGTEKIQFAIEIAKATSKELKVILVDGLEALSETDMKAFVEKCKDDNEYQYIMTRVTDGFLKVIDGEGEIVDIKSEIINREDVE